MTNLKLLVIGHLARDVVKTKTGTGEFWGGAGYHVAMAAAMYLPSGDVVLKSSAGKDFDKKILIEKGINSNYLKINESENCDKHFLDESTDKREYFSEGILSEEIDLMDLGPVIEEIGWIHLASSPPEQQLKWLSQIESFGKKDILISADTFDTFAAETPDKVRKVFEQCTLGFLNQGEWANLGANNMKMKLVRKLGEMGAEIFDNGEKILSVECERDVKVVDTTGAGEVVAGVYLARKILGLQDEEALREAIKMATKSVENFGTDHLRT